MSDQPHPAVRFVIRHWERLTVAMVGVVVVAFGVITSLGLAAALRPSAPTPPTGGQQVRAAFDDTAFDYLNPGTATVGETHAMRVAGGPDEPEVTTTTTVPDETTTATATTTTTVVTEITDTASTTETTEVDDRGPLPPDFTETDAVPEDANRYLTYQGFMTLPSGGDPQAFFLREQGMDSEQAKSPSGGTIDGLTVQAFDENTVTLRTADGQRIIIRRGERRQLTP